MSNNSFQRPTNMADAFVRAIVKQDPKQKNWISRCVADRALHTQTGNVQERDHFNLKSFVKKEHEVTNRQERKHG